MRGPWRLPGWGGGVDADACWKTRAPTPLQPHDLHPYALHPCTPFHPIPSIPPHPTPSAPSRPPAPVPRSDVFTAAMKTVDVTFQNLDSSEISLTDVSHYFDSDPTKLGELRWAAAGSAAGGRHSAAGCRHSAAGGRHSAAVRRARLAAWLALLWRCWELPRLQPCIACPAAWLASKAPACPLTCPAFCQPVLPHPSFLQWLACATTARCLPPSSPTPPPPTRRWAAALPASAAHAATAA